MKWSSLQKHPLEEENPDSACQNQYTRDQEEKQCCSCQDLCVWVARDVSVCPANNTGHSVFCLPVLSRAAGSPMNHSKITPFPLYLLQHRSREQQKLYQQAWPAQQKKMLMNLLWKEFICLVSDSLRWPCKTMLETWLGGNVQQKRTVAYYYYYYRFAFCVSDEHLQTNLKKCKKIMGNSVYLLNLMNCLMQSFVN